MLVIHPDECIDCGVCEPECPVEAIKPDTEVDAAEKWLEINRQYSEAWPNITRKKEAPGDADQWKDVPDKFEKHRSEEHTSELQSLMRISYAVFCLKKKRKRQKKDEQKNNDKKILIIRNR